MAATQDHVDEVDADPEQVARLILLRRLSTAPRTRVELQDLLRSRGVPDEVAERVLDRFVDVGLIDDAQFAQDWVESRHRSRGSARSLLRRELRSKGVDPAVVEEALSQVDADDERARAHALVTARARSLERLAPEARARRLIGMLQRRGYPAGVAAGVVREVLSGDPGAGGLLETSVD